MTHVIPEPGRAKHLDRANCSSSTKQMGRGNCLPTFLGIGAMRCGSTWLYEVLKSHPDIQVSSSKEMDFFFMGQMLEHDLGWYESHFKPAGGLEPKPVRGEISPRYARLKAWQVKRISKLLPDLRILLTLRHPIERVWSQALYDFGRLQQRDVTQIKPVEFLYHLERARSRLSSDYFRTAKIWCDVFGKEAVHIGLFHEFRDNPQTYVETVLRHIGASRPWSVPEEYRNKKVWETNRFVNNGREIPEIVRWYIADQLIESTEKLDEFLGGRVSMWVEELRAIRGTTRLSWRIWKELNRTVLSFPESVAYKAYHATLDLRLWARWRRLRQPE